MADITPTEVTLAGVTPPALVAGALSQSVEWKPGLQIRIENTHSGPIAVALVAQQESDQDVLHDADITVVLTDGKQITGPVPERFKDALGNVVVTIDDITACTIGATFQGEVDVPDVAQI